MTESELSRQMEKHRPAPEEYRACLYLLRLMHSGWYGTVEFVLAKGKWVESKEHRVRKPWEIPLS